MLSEELQKALDAAFVSARMEGHELLTVEHLLLALLSDTHVAEALNSGGADTDKLAAAMSGLEAPASVSFPAGSITIRAADHQGVVPLYIGHVEGGSERVTHQITAKEIGAIK